MNWHAHQLRQQIKKGAEKWKLLETINPASQEYLNLETEINQLKEKVNKLKTELTETDNIADDLAQEISVKDQTLTEWEVRYQQLELYSDQELTKLIKENKELTAYHLREINRWQQEKQALKDKHKQEKSLFSKDKEKIIAENLELTNNLDEWEKVITEFLGKYKVNNLAQLDKKLNNYVQTVNNQIIQLKRLESQITNQETQSHQAKVIFNSIISIIAKNTTFILTNKKDLKTAITQIQETMNWEKTNLPDFGASTTSLPISPDKEKAQLLKQIDKLTNDQTDLQQEIRALKLDKAELLRKLASTPTPSEPATPITLKPVPKPSKKLEKWQNIDLNFTDELIKQWESTGLKFEKVREWITIGLAVQDANLVNWLIKIKKGNYAKPDWLLNHGNIEQLRTEFKNYKK